MNAEPKKCDQHACGCCSAKSRKATDEDLTEVIEKLKNNEDLNRCVVKKKTDRREDVDCLFGLLI